MINSQIKHQVKFINTAAVVLPLMFTLDFP